MSRPISISNFEAEVECADMMEKNGRPSRRLVALLVALSVILVIGALSPFIFHYLYTAYAVSAATSNNERTAEFFAARLQQGWGTELPAASEVKSSVGEVAIFSSARGTQNLVLKVAVTTGKENLIGSTTFIRCYTLTFERLRSGGFQHTVEPLAGCPYEDG
ncbi:hypothetical protein ACTWPT_40080 [Nonomuraea sp. 3N208]|uniref:hypothetical protein n=1 Tax=Nonomuraea sp. 3N208 TaxID=3457421 RepID=UPI003FD4242E